MKQKHLIIKDYDNEQNYVIINWVGTYISPNTRQVSKMDKTEIFEFDHIPTEVEIKHWFEQTYSNIISNPDWKNISIVDYNILLAKQKAKIILK